MNMFAVYSIVYQIVCTSGWSYNNILIHFLILLLYSWQFTSSLQKKNLFMVLESSRTIKRFVSLANQGLIRVSRDPESNPGNKSICPWTEHQGQNDLVKIFLNPFCDEFVLSSQATIAKNFLYKIYVLTAIVLPYTHLIITISNSLLRPQCTANGLFKQQSTINILSTF